MRELTAAEQKVMEQGIEAEAFLTNTAMASAINELSEGIANAILNTAPDQTEKRERHYYLHTALKELVAILNYRVSAKQTLESTLEDAPENE